MIPWPSCVYIYYTIHNTLASMSIAGADLGILLGGGGVGAGILLRGGGGGLGSRSTGIFIY